MAATNFDYYLMSDDFYRAFEERYYAPQDIIKQMRQQYLPFVQPLALLHPKSQTFDIGCGRGEWLEIMAESGLTPYGVDLDDGMLQACQEKGLPAKKGDAIEYLKTLTSESQLVVSAFHVVEHITFNELRTVVSEALRVLMPGGLLIMETPNPENITVATRNFYLDPTHQKPIPSQLLAFLPEYYGFSKVKVIRLQEEKSLVSKTWTSLGNVLGGVSPDYAVVAQKSGSGPLLMCTNDAFAQEYGLTLDVLVEKFDQQAIRASERAASAEAQAQQASERAASAEAQAQQASGRAASAEAQAQQASGRAASAEAQALQASERAVNAVSALTAVHHSASWRLTAPLRMVSRIVRTFSQGPKALKPAIQTKAKLLLAHASLYVNLRPKLKHVALGVLARFPTLKARLKVAMMNRSFAQTAAPTVSIDLANLTPYARQIYVDLKAAIEHRQNEGS